MGSPPLVEAAYAAIDAMVLLLDAADFSIRFANPAFCLATGYCSEELRDRPFAMLYARDVPPQTRRRIEAILVPGGSKSWPVAVTGPASGAILRSARSPKCRAGSMLPCCATSRANARTWPRSRTPMI
ncbi:MAG: PAS domain S-box protein [Aliidongia sp.]